MHIMDILFNWGNDKIEPKLIAKILGCVFLVLGGAGGAFFFFLALIPEVGYLVSGGITCAILVTIGTALLLISMQKRKPSQEEVSRRIGDFFNETNINKFIEKNGIAFSLLSLGVGIILSQIDPIKHISQIVKKEHTHE